MFEAAAVAVSPLVVLGIEELGEDIAVGAVDLDPVKPGLLGADGGGDEVIAELFDFRRGQRARSGFGVGEGSLRVFADHITR